MYSVSSFTQFSPPLGRTTVTVGSIIKNLADIPSSAVCVSRPSGTPHSTTLTLALVVKISGIKSHK